MSCAQTKTMRRTREGRTDEINWNPEAYGTKNKDDFDRDTTAFSSRVHN